MKHPEQHDLSRFGLIAPGGLRRNDEQSENYSLENEMHDDPL
jgi:hypothetical protein